MPSAGPDPAAAPTLIPPATLARFRDALKALNANAPFGIAVSGGPDSLALLLLAHAACPGGIIAATVDHGLRPAGADEAAAVAAICSAFGIPHHILQDDWGDDRGEGVQAAARRHRYRLMKKWCATNHLTALLTAHHADDQAETMLMRLARGSGVGGLAGIRPTARIDGLAVLRPLLGFAKRDLVEIVAAAGLTAAHDPSNDDPRFDRTHARRLLREQQWLRPERMTTAARNLMQAEEALDWAARAAFDRHVTIAEDALLLDPIGLPDEIVHRLVQRILATFDAGMVWRGSDVARLITTLRAGRSGTLGPVLARPGPVWRFAAAPPRRQ